MMTSRGEHAYGRRLLPLVLDELAEANPNRLYATIPKTADITGGFRDITIADFARCVNFMAQWIESIFGRSNSFETITYIGISDLRGPIVFYAAVKCGYKLLLPSPRNPPSTNISLMDQTGSTKVLHPLEVSPLVKQLQGLKPSVRTETVPSFDGMMRSTPEHYRYRKSFYEARDDPIVVLSSSGSTGNPKPITMTHGSFAAYDNEMNLPSVPGRKKRDSSIWNFDGEARVYMVFPFFHLGGFAFFIFHTTFRNASLVLGPPHMIPDGPLLKSVILQQKLRAIFLVPSVIEQLLQEPNGIDLFKDVDFVAYSGAPSSNVVGDRLSRVVELISPFGSTEIIAVPELSLPREEWAWHEFNPHFKHEMQPYDPTNSTFELVLFADESNKDSTAVYHNLPGVTEYRTKDLFTQHPEKPTLFKYYGRRDDIIVLSNGEKFNPIPLEVNIQSYRSINGALMIGNGRAQTALLIEPREPLDEVARNNFLEDIWPYIEESNGLVPGPGRLSRALVICALPNKHFARTAKGTVVRRLTEQAYKEELERLYSSSSSNDRTVTVELKPILGRNVYEQPAVLNFLRSIIAASFAQGARIGEDDDFYSYGLDSVQTLEITSNLKRILQEQTSKPVTWISPRTIYRNPTLADLSRIVVAFLQDGTVPEEDHQLARARLMDEIAAEHVESLPKRSSLQSSSVPSKTSTVAVIGSTGYLGSHIVMNLLRNPEICRIICLNRGNDAEQRQSATLRRLDEAVGPLLQKLEHMTVKLGQPLLGLTKDEFDLIAHEADVIVYNSWRLDFGLTIRSFSPFLRATRDLVELSATSSRNMRIIFVSSVSSVSGLATKTTVPEAPVEDPLAAINMGYAQSKLAAERILTIANREIGIPVSIVRVCQVGGSINAGAGAWADQPWISALLRTAKTMGCCPTGVAPIDWVPVDTVAAMLGDFILCPAREEAQIFNIFPPKPQPWELLVDIMRDTYRTTEAVPLREWIGKLRSVTDPNAEDVAKMPALKILDYYEAIDKAGSEAVAFVIDHAMSVSKVRIPTLDKQMMENWLRSWNL